MDHGLWKQLEQRSLGKAVVCSGRCMGEHLITMILSVLVTLVILVLVDMVIFVLVDMVMLVLVNMVILNLVTMVVHQEGQNVNAVSVMDALPRAQGQRIIKLSGRCKTSTHYHHI